MSCAPGEVCVSTPGGIDAGGPYVPRCVQVPSGCALEDCTGGDCADCVLELCGCPELADRCEWATLDGRDLSCPGQ